MARMEGMTSGGRAARSSGDAFPGADGKFEFVSVPFGGDPSEGVEGGAAGRKRAASTAGAGRNPLETSLASCGFVLENGVGGGDSMATAAAQISLQNSVQLAMGTYYDNVNVICGGAGGAGNPVSSTSTGEFFLPYLSYEGGFGNASQLNYISIAFPQLRDVNDAPEYIDIGDMPTALHGAEPEKRQDNSSAAKPTPGDEERASSDDDVIFVGAYAGNKPEEDADDGNETAAQSTRGARKRVGTVAERKNPKRMTRSCRASESLALKLSIPQQVFNAKIARGAPKPAALLTKNLKPINKSPSADDDDVDDEKSKENRAPVRKKAAVKKPKPIGRTGGRRKLLGNARSRLKEKQMRKKNLENLVQETLEASLRFVEQIKCHNELMADVQDEKKTQTNVKLALDIFADSFVLCSIVRDVDQMDLLQSLPEKETGDACHDGGKCGCAPQSFLTQQQIVL